MTAAKGNTPRRALVLGCGGVAGAAWTIAMLSQLEQQLNWDARTADILVGTSAGAVLAALLGAGVPASTLLDCQHGTAKACQWNHDSDSGGALPPLPAASLTSPSLLLRGLKAQVSALTAISGVLPAGQFNMAPFRQLIDSVVPAGEWAPHPATWIMTVDTASGQRVAFGKQHAPTAALNDAVCASYGVPAWCPPVTIGGRRYFDGGVASPTSADLLVHQPVEEVIILAPMASRQPDRPLSPLKLVERQVRRYMTAIVDREEQLLRDAGKRVIRVEPNAADLTAFGYNMMDPGRRTKVLSQALLGAPATVAMAIASA
ncbi:patatin-like phospholipase family protein [Marinobacter sp. SS21]|uniref:patatin-like phospholipase family protein n=1 Tax=Marinobacter sp. SS21 TaxID=2979460 RepID=UPI00232B2A2E|nr:patatin-like phospholipase family protein [Marinobacter sp. SS21]MDC0662727.1 patatin-like phospholipase family protein [Marinobacter sp. SS21]